MAWIEVHQGLWTNPKTTAFAQALKIDPVYAGGLLCRLWCWAIDAAKPDGDISHLPVVEIATAAGWRKSPKAFFKALITVYDGCGSAWVDNLGKDVYKMHDWDTYTGKLQERRRKDRDRKCRDKSIGRNEGIPLEIPTESPRNIHGNTTETLTLPYPNRTLDDDDDNTSSVRAREEISQAYMEAVGKQPTPEELTTLARWLEQGLGADMVCDAIQRAALANADNRTAYAFECLKNWHRAGYRTMLDVGKAEAERDIKAGRICP